MTMIPVEPELMEHAHTYGKILMDHPEVGVNFMSWHKSRFRTAYILNRLVEIFGRILVVFVPKDEDKAFRYPTHNVHINIQVADNELTSWLTNFVAGELELSQDEYHLIAYQDPMEFEPGKEMNYTTVKVD